MNALAATACTDRPPCDLWQPKLEVIRLGRAAYAPTLALQHRLARRVRSEPDRATLLLVEHDPPVITLGRRGRRSDVLASREELAAAGVEVHRVLRGGQATCHSPGQLVAYAILHLHCLGLTLREYVARLEDAAVLTLRRFGLAARRDDAQPGVWIDGAKVAFVGVAVRRWVTSHGLAINVSNDPRCFEWIVPCGRAGGHMTSLVERLGREVAVAEVAGVLEESFAEVFGFQAGAT